MKFFSLSAAVLLAANTAAAEEYTREQLEACQALSEFARAIHTRRQEGEARSSILMDYLEDPVLVSLVDDSFKYFETGRTEDERRRNVDIFVSEIDIFCLAGTGSHAEWRP